MSERRRRESTVVESGFGGGAPAYPSGQATVMESGPASSGFQNPAGFGGQSGFPAPGAQGGWSAQGASTPPSQGGWSQQQAAAPARRRDATVVDEPTPRAPQAPQMAPAPARNPMPSAAPRTATARRIAGWLLSVDAMQSHVLRSGTNLIGRGPDNDIILDNQLVSGLQCNIICEEDQTLLMPRPEARNATTIEDRSIYQTAEIPEGARISFAGSEFVYVPAPWRQRRY